MAKPPDEIDGDPFPISLERSTIAQTLKAARQSVSLADPTRPFTPLDRSLFQLPSHDDASRPNSGYTVTGLNFVGDTYGRPSSRSRTSKQPDTIHEDGAEILYLEDDASRPSHELDDLGSSSGSEELTPVGLVSPSQTPRVPARVPSRPPRPPGVSPLGAAASQLRSSRAVDASEASPRRLHRASDLSPGRLRPAPSSSRGGATGSTHPGTPRRDLDADCEAVIVNLQALGSDDRQHDAARMTENVWDVVQELKLSKSVRSRENGGKLLRAVLGLMDLKNVSCLFRLSRCALALLQMEGAVQGVPASGVEAAYLNIAKVLFKFSKNDAHDSDFLREGLLVPLLEVLQSDSPPCSSDVLRVYVVGVLKNISHDESNQKVLQQQGAVNVLFRLMGSDQLCGSSKEAQLLIQIAATLRNLANHHYKAFLHEEKLNAITRIMALFPSNLELLTNISRILSKLTLHNSAVEALAKSDVHLRQISRTLSANSDCAPLVLRLAFTLGNLTARSDRLRVIFAFNCEGSALVPQLLGKYWAKDRQLARLHAETGGTAKVAGEQDVEEVLVKLVRLLANIGISPSVGATLASSSAVADPLLDMLGAKRVAESEELVLNVVAAVTNLLFYDVPSNLLFQVDNKKLLCRLFRPLLLESYNTDALVETARALGNLSRHTDARQTVKSLRLDEILVILLDHDHRDLVFYVCGALVNLAADPDCTSRLTTVCAMPQKLGQLLGDVLLEDVGLQLVAVKVLTNLSLDPNVSWLSQDVASIREALQELVSGQLEPPDNETNVSDGPSEAEQMMTLSQQLLCRLPEPDQIRQEEKVWEKARIHVCDAVGCGRTFETREKLLAHIDRRHSFEKEN